MWPTDTLRVRSALDLEGNVSAEKHLALLQLASGLIALRQAHVTIIENPAVAGYGVRSCLAHRLDVVTELVDFAVVASSGHPADSRRDEGADWNGCERDRRRGGEVALFDGGSAAASATKECCTSSRRSRRRQRRAA
jgi:hypothetical protein